MAGDLLLDRGAVAGNPSLGWHHMGSCALRRSRVDDRGLPPKGTPYEAVVEAMNGTTLLG